MSEGAHYLPTCTCLLCHSWKRVGSLLSRGDLSPQFRAIAVAKIRDLHGILLDFAEGYIGDPPVAAGGFPFYSAPPGGLASPPVQAGSPGIQSSASERPQREANNSTPLSAGPANPATTPLGATFPQASTAPARPVKEEQPSPSRKPKRSHSKKRRQEKSKKDKKEKAKKSRAASSRGEVGDEAVVVDSPVEVRRGLREENEKTPEAGKKEKAAPVSLVEEEHAQAVEAMQRRGCTSRRRGERGRRGRVARCRRKS